MNYGLKVSSPYTEAEKKIITGSGDIVIAVPGIYEIRCLADTYIHHNVINDLIHIYCISYNDNINININSTGLLDTGIADIYHSIEAKHNNVNSNIRCKAVAEGDSKIIYRSDLQATLASTGRGTQIAKFLLLSDRAEIDTEPSLDINSQEFPTSHSASVSGLELDLLWYMNSRAYDEKEAKQELINSFLN